MGTNASTPTRRLRLGPLCSGPKRTLTESEVIQEWDADRQIKGSCKAAVSGSCKVTTVLAQSMIMLQAYLLPSGHLELHSVMRIDPETDEGRLLQRVLKGAGFHGEEVVVRTRPEKKWLESVL